MAGVQTEAESVNFSIITPSEKMLGAMLLLAEAYGKKNAPVPWREAKLSATKDRYTMADGMFGWHGLLASHVFFVPRGREYPSYARRWVTMKNGVEIVNRSFMATPQKTRGFHATRHRGKLSGAPQGAFSQ
ncbi:MAG: hypothetical protein K8S55_02685 [Phycisphaerae bacterium]|nr:hypothetical protein [Phycisphaerae bacterium]